MSTFTARYPGRCGICDEAIRVGDACAYVDDEVCHVSCPSWSTVSVEPCPNCWQVPALNGECGCDR